MFSLHFTIYFERYDVELRIKAYLSVLLLVASAALSGFFVSGLLTTRKILSSTGSVKTINVEVYWDLDCTQVASSLDWGSPKPGDVIYRTIYIKNTGSVPMTLHLNCSGWNPSGVEKYLMVSWDRQGAILNIDEVVQAILKLSVSSTVSGITDFSFNIVIEGTG